jgi:DNA polymerase I
MMTAFNNDLIFGKDTLQNVVSCEVQGDQFIVFTEDDGKVNKRIFTNENWVLSSKPLADDFERLDGNLHYKWGKIYTDNDYYQSLKPKMYKHDTYFVGDDREQNLTIKGITYFKGLNPKDISLLSFDIEATGLTHDKNSKLLLIANTFRKNGVTTRKMFCYDEYENEGKMIEAWCAWVREMDPSIIMGHNIFNYDINYIKYIADKFKVKLKLGRDGSALEFRNKPGKYRVDGSRDMEYTQVRCWGRELLDTMFLAMRYDAVAKKYESYGLKPIIDAENLTAEGRVFYDASQIRHNYTIPEEWAKIKAYAEFDGDDPIKLYDKMIAAYFYFTQSIPKSFQSMMLSATGSQLNSLLVRAYLQHGHSVPKGEGKEDYQGAISFGNQGIHKNAFKVDVKSLYPSIQRDTF